MKKSSRVIRKAYGGGRWFSGGHEELVAEVEVYIEQAEVPECVGHVVGVISPHAGYVYSGAVAGHSFRALRDSLSGENEPLTVVVLGFSHSEGFSGVALMDGDAIETPVAETDLDMEAGDFLVGEADCIHFDYCPHMGEHSAENQIPFIQVALPKAKLVLALIGDHRDETCKELAEALRKLAEDQRIVVVASTDLLHDASYELVTDTDKKTLSMIAGLDEAGLESAWSFGKQVCCGVGPVLALMQFARLEGVKSGTVLKYRNSGDDYPESRGSWVVGYGSIVF